jgi:hypothetical protein
MDVNADVNANAYIDAITFISFQYSCVCVCVYAFLYVYVYTGDDV